MAAAVARPMALSLALPLQSIALSPSSNSNDLRASQNHVTEKTDPDTDQDSTRHSPVTSALRFVNVPLYTDPDSCTRAAHSFDYAPEVRRFADMKGDSEACATQ